MRHLNLGIFTPFTETCAYCAFRFDLQSFSCSRKGDTDILIILVGLRIQIKFLNMPFTGVQRLFQYDCRNVFRSFAANHGQYFLIFENVEQTLYRILYLSQYSLMLWYILDCSSVFITPPAVARAVRGHVKYQYNFRSCE